MDRLQNVSQILAIRLSGIGDVVLLMPALAHLKAAFANASVTLITGSQCASVAELCPYIDRVIPVDRKGLRQLPRIRALAEILRLVGHLRKGRFDLVVDFHSLRETNLLAWASGARYRIGLRRSQRAYLGLCFNLDPTVQDNTLHIRQMFGKLAENVPGVGRIGNDPGPMIEPPEAARARAGGLRPAGPVLVLNVGASRGPRRWAASRFGAVATHAVDTLGASVIVLGGASTDEESHAREAVECARRPERVRLANGLSFPEVVAVIETADLLVSNDTGPMHLGPALGTPTIGIFSGGSPHHYRPTGPLDRHVEGQSMDEIEIETVIHAVEGVWAQLEFKQQ